MSKVATATRRLEFDSGHRVTRHESKCRHVHGHRYRVEVTCEAPSLDEAGRVIDFGAIKEKVGTWLDDHLDHGYIAHPDDLVGTNLAAGGFKVFRMPVDLGEPTAENLAALIARKSAELLKSSGITVSAVRVYETPNCWADWTRDG